MRQNKHLRTNRKSDTCRRGHPFTEENTYYYKGADGYTIRVCRRFNRERSNFRLRLYGMTKDEYAKLLDLQGGLCAICGGTTSGRALSVDHDHATGRVRALLCNGCNVGLAQFRHDAALLLRAVQYLAKWRGEFAAGS